MTEADPDEEGIAAVLALADLRGGGGVARGRLDAINFHNTGRRRARDLERTLREAGERFAAIDERGLDALLDGQPHDGGRPPLLPVFYEGFRTNYDVALPLVERAGLTAWFAIPTRFLDAPPAEQRAHAERYEIILSRDPEPGDGRHAMTWDELRDVVDRGHVVVSHTATHRAIGDLHTPEARRRELDGSRARLRAETGCDAATVVFQWGSPFGRVPEVDAAIVAAGYRRVLSNLAIQRLPGA
jgi:peptidoglycan/xylan/chitin deacetylase (PgdA/CDA1 family)